MKSRSQLLMAVLLLVASSFVIGADQFTDTGSKTSVATWNCEQSASQATQDSRQAGMLLAQMSCRECQVRRDRCHTGCNSLSSSREQLQCVNRCNANYPCVQGSDCR